MYVCMIVCMYVCIYVCMIVCMYVCTYVWRARVFSGKLHLCARVSAECFEASIPGPIWIWVATGRASIDQGSCCGCGCASAVVMQVNHVWQTADGKSVWREKRHWVCYIYIYIYMRVNSLVTSRSCWLQIIKEVAFRDASWLMLTYTSVQTRNCCARCNSNVIVDVCSERSDG